MIKVLVTGGHGFLGRHVCATLKERGVYRIFVPTKEQFDLREPREALALFRRVRPDLVIHLAATVGGIGANALDPVRFFRDNMLMGMNVIESAGLVGAPKVVIAGTVCSYPKHTPVPFSEADFWNGYPEETNAPYGVAKKALLSLGMAYATEFGSRVVMPVLSNLYGPHDCFDLNRGHVIPAMIVKLSATAKDREPRVYLWGDGTPTRDFLFVNDGAEAIVLAAERYEDSSSPLNIGTGIETSMSELASKIAAMVGYDGEIMWNTRMPNGQPRRVLSTEKAAGLGFTASTSLDTGLKRTVAWWASERG